ncbi:MAG TPA: hypothetical protein EYN91_17555 [Candidatus Melainabacteria bacterium]|mgnify:CR=1 FL=1|jgi:hypothetical protein|nr:hypothetical protein [Candidatus Melainabacteria bacterium]HIN63896.1 hypothetical protein [Candidatus Obscuribacterales bacterium]
MAGVNRFRKMAKATLVWAAAVACIAPASAKGDDFIMDTDCIGKTNNGVVTSDQFLELGVPTSNALRLEGEQSMRIGNLDRALTVLQRSVEMAPMDIDGRILYAEALEKKLLKQRKRDPKLYNFIVKQWLYVGKKAEFADQQMIGINHLMSLTGTRPGRWEKEAKFLGRVLVPEDAPVKIGGASPHAAKKKKDEDM